MTHVRTEPAVAVIRDTDRETLLRRLARGPLVVVSDRAELAAEIAAAADHAWALVPPDIDEPALQAVIRAVGAGFTVLPPSLAGLVTRLGRSAQVARAPFDDDGARVERLTARERDVLQRLAEGLSNRAIAGALGISEHTVKFHLASIFGKLGATTRTEAVRLGLRQGLVAI